MFLNINLLAAFKSQRFALTHSQNGQTRSTASLGKNCHRSFASWLPRVRVDVAERLDGAVLCAICG